MSHIHIEPLKRENYDTWRIHAKALLLKKGLWNYVSETIKKPTGEGDELNKYLEKDVLALAELFLIISPSELKQVKNCQTSKDVWDTLEGIYHSKGPARKASLLKELILRKMKEGDNVVDHLNKFMDIVDKLGDMDIEINKDLLSVMMLYSLSQSFENFRIAIESRDDLPNPENLKIKIIEQAEARRNMANTSEQNSEQEALYSRQRRRNKNVIVECYKCKKRGHKANECWSKVVQGNKSISNLCCSEETCLNTNDSKEKLNKWCLDSGCTSHMTYELERFQNLVKEESKSLKLASENCTAQIKGRGSAKLNIKERPDLQLNEALYVPSLTTNLISVGKITDKGATVLFKQKNATVKYNGQILLRAERNEDGLYYVKENIQEKARFCEANKMQQWHRKLAHLNEGQMRIALDKKNMEGLEFNKNDTVKDCEVCAKGKAIKLPFNTPKNEERTNEKLQIVHTDVCGPMRQLSKAGSKYFITFTDDYSRYTRVYIMKTKDEALSKFKEFKNEAERFTKQKIVCLQSDNGTEYINHEFEKYLKDNGIKRRLSAPYTPEQNGLGERKNRTLLDKARCMLIDANMKEVFWAEAINTANYLANRSPCSSINNETPFQKWVNRVPSVRHFHIFGTKAFVLKKRKPPVWQKDYEMDAEQSFLCDIDENSDEWEDAIISEIESHLKNNTWKIVHKNESKNLIDNKLILKYKYNALGEIDRRKARLVARGFNQREGIDYTETFAPVAKMSTIRLLIAYAIENNMKLSQLDVCTAFLNGDIDEQIYMKKPKNLDKYLKMIISHGKDKELMRKAREMLIDINKYKNNGICQLNKAIYGLKQAGRQWYLKLHRKLMEIGFRNATADPCLYIFEKGGEKLFANIYVDDLILAYKSENVLKEVKSKLEKAFDLRDMGSLHHCLGIRFNHVGGEMTLSQETYIDNLIERFNMGECKPVSTPMEPALKLEKNENEDEKENFLYQKLIGSLMYLAVATRPDIMFAVSYLSQYNNCYDQSHWQAAKRVIRYLKGTKNICLRYKKTGTLTALTGMADADWAACTIDRRSYTGYIFKYGGGLISYETKKQRVVALSTAEAEYMAMTEATKEALHLKHLLEDIGVPQQTVLIYNDNMAAQKLANNMITGKKSKHISIKEHFNAKEVSNNSLQGHRKYGGRYFNKGAATTKVVKIAKNDGTRSHSDLKIIFVRGSVIDNVSMIY